MILHEIGLLITYDIASNILIAFTIIAMCKPVTPKKTIKKRCDAFYEILFHYDLGNLYKFAVFVEICGYFGQVR